MSAPVPPKRRRLRVGVDVGGTFTDFALFDEVNGEIRIHKTPTTAPDESLGFLSGLQHLFRVTRTTPHAVEYLAHGTTVSTNAALQGQFAKVGVITTQGFRDLLEIRRQKRPSLYDLFYSPPTPPVDRDLRREVPERVTASGDVLCALDEDAVATAALHLKKQGVQAICVCFINSFAYPAHELRAAEVVRSASGLAVWASHQVLPEFREFERLSTTVIHAGLGPVMSRYLVSLDSNLRQLKVAAPVHVMQSNGGVMSIGAALDRPANTLLSGPSAGVVGAVHIAGLAGERDIITFDMGGTSTDVCLVREGQPELVMQRDVAGYPLRAPMIDVHTVGAGGGSVAWVDSGGRLKIGPESVGAQPGPAAYGLGGTQATVTDANVVLGRLSPAGLLDGAMPLDLDRAKDAVKRQVADKLGIRVVPAAAAIIAIANSNMVLAARSVSVQKGIDPREFVLVAYGGAGPLHAAEVAPELGARGILVPESPGVVCAYGLLACDLQSHYVRTVMAPNGEVDDAKIADEWDRLANEAMRWFELEAVAAKDQRLERFADMRYRGQNYELRIGVPGGRWDSSAWKEVVANFHTKHQEAYGYASEQEPVELVSLRLMATGRIPKVTASVGAQRTPGKPSSHHREVWWASTKRFEPTPILHRASLEVEENVVGPAVVEQLDSTTLIAPGQVGRLDMRGTMRIALAAPPNARLT